MCACTKYTVEQSEGGHLPHVREYKHMYTLQWVHTFNMEAHTYVTSIARVMLQSGSILPMRLIH